MNKVSFCKYSGECGNCLPLGSFCSTSRNSIACEALREKAERERGCIFCREFKDEVSMTADYCSHCGRKLKK